MLALCRGLWFGWCLLDAWWGTRTYVLELPLGLLLLPLIVDIFTSLSLDQFMVFCVSYQVSFVKIWLSVSLLCIYVCAEHDVKPLYTHSLACCCALSVRCEVLTGAKGLAKQRYMSCLVGLLAACAEVIGNHVLYLLVLISFLPGNL